MALLTSFKLSHPVIYVIVHKLSLEINTGFAKQVLLAQEQTSLAI